jgi:hypothetical protein
VDEPSHSVTARSPGQNGAVCRYTRRVTPASWLFVKGDQSIWIERPYGHSMIVAGPGKLREHHYFDNEDALQSYQMALADKLASAGWLLWGVNRQRRSGPDRRRTGRDTSDRRYSPAHDSAR